MVRKLFSSLNMIIRTLKNLFLSPFRTALVRIKYFFNAGGLASKIPAAAKKLPVILKTKPEKREDYFDWGSIYIAKSLVLIWLLILIITPITIIYIIIPLWTRYFGVKQFFIEDDSLDSYSGKVQIYYDESYECLYFEGELNDGLKADHGEEFYENGRHKFSGNYSDDLYEGDGTLYYEDGAVQYKGGFSKGLYSGIGELTDTDDLVYTGNFSNGTLQGYGTIYENGYLYYEGNFIDGKMSGEGIIYFQNGTVKYNGSFCANTYNGNGVLYNENGLRIYSGGFELGKYNGTGTLNDGNGKRIYAGGFEDGLYSGSGTIYSQDYTLTAEFESGETVGNVECVFSNGMVYEGGFAGNQMNDAGTLTDKSRGFYYSGNFIDNEIDFSTIIGLEAADITNYFGDTLTQTADSDCFYLSNELISLKCAYAVDNVPAQVTEIAVFPYFGEIEIIEAAEINAPGAVSVIKANQTVPEWISAELGEADCYAVEYEEYTVYYWVSGNQLQMKTVAGNTSSDSESEIDNQQSDNFTLTDEELESLFEEFGLDIEDFRGLGF